MVGIVTGNNLGLDTSSLAKLSQGGVLGNAAHGRAGESVYVNTANGNLVVQQRDEVRVCRGPDAELVRTYNSQGVLREDPDGADNWLPGWSKQVFDLSGTLNTSGSSISRRDAQGALTRYVYSGGFAAYVCTLGEGAQDTLRHDSTRDAWTWTAGSTRVKEVYSAFDGRWRLTTRQDMDNNCVSYSYDAQGKLAALSTAAGEHSHCEARVLHRRIIAGRGRDQFAFRSGWVRACPRRLQCCCQSGEHPHRAFNAGTGSRSERLDAAAGTASRTGQRLLARLGGTGRGARKSRTGGCAAELDIKRRAAGLAVLRAAEGGHLNVVQRLVEAGTSISEVLGASTALGRAIKKLDPSNPFDGSCRSASLNFNELGISSVSKSIDSIAPCDIGILVVEDPAFTGILTVNIVERVTNDSEIPWHDYHFVLGTNSGSEFRPALPPTGGDDDLFFGDGTVIGGEVPSSDRFALDGQQSNQINFLTDGEDLAPGQFAEFEFTVFVPVTNGEGRFTLRQIPTLLAEPESITLFMLSLMGLALTGGKIRAKFGASSS